MTSEGISTTRDCPYCGEAVLAKAQKCKHCGEFFEGSRTPPAMSAAPASQVFMNAGGAAIGGYHLRRWGHLRHLFASLLTAGLWVPVWVLLYMNRNKHIFY